MKRTLLTFFAVAILASAALAEEVKFTVMIDSKPSGTGIFRRTVQKSGDVVVDMNMTLNVASGSQTTTVKTYTQTILSSTGLPKKVVGAQEVPNAGKSSVTQTYTATDVKLTIDVLGSIQNQSLKLPAGNYKNAWAFWFWKTKPKVGQKDSVMRLDPQTMKFDTQTTTYVGPESTMVGGKSVKAHLLTIDANKMWVDDRGMVLKGEIKQGGLTIKIERSK